MSITVAKASCMLVKSAPTRRHANLTVPESLALANPVVGIHSCQPLVWLLHIYYEGTPNACRSPPRSLSSYRLGSPPMAAVSTSPTGNSLSSTSPPKPTPTDSTHRLATRQCHHYRTQAPSPPPLPNLLYSWRSSPMLAPQQLTTITSTLGVAAIAPINPLSDEAAAPPLSPHATRCATVSLRRHSPLEFKSVVLTLVVAFRQREGERRHAIGSGRHRSHAVR
jgi:hypothetical protein